MACLQGLVQGGFTLGSSTGIKTINRWEFHKLHLQYEAHRETVRAELDSGLEKAESRLWHGTDATRDVLKSDFSSSHVNMKFNKYGAGVYVARDPRRAHYFIRESRYYQHNAEIQIVLSRIVLGWCLVALCLAGSSGES